VPEDDEPEDWCILPTGTEIQIPDIFNQVILTFPSADDAIYFHEFLRAWVNGEIDIEVVKS